MTFIKNIYKVKLELLNTEIESIIDELDRVPHNAYEFMKFEILIDKLKTALNKYNDGPQRENTTNSTSPSISSSVDNMGSEDVCSTKEILCKCGHAKSSHGYTGYSDGSNDLGKGLCRTCEGNEDREECLKFRASTFHAPDRIRELKNFGTRQSLAEQIVELERANVIMQKELKRLGAFELKRNASQSQKYEVPIICKGCGKTCEWDDDGLCEECGKLEYEEDSNPENFDDGLTQVPLEGQFKAIGCGKINVYNGTTCGEVKWNKIQLCNECKNQNKVNSPQKQEGHVDVKTSSEGLPSFLFSTIDL